MDIVSSYLESLDWSWQKSIVYIFIGFISSLNGSYIFSLTYQTLSYNKLIIYNIYEPKH